MARPDPENVYIDLDSLVLERQMPLILQDCVSRDTLEKEREWLDPERFAQVVEERALSCKCGWPCCGRGISRRNAELVGDDSQPLVYASGATQTLYNMRAALQFCGLACNRAARLFMMSLDTSALGLRPCYARRLRPHAAPDAAAPLPEVLAYSVVQEHEPTAVLDDDSSSDDEDDCAGLVRGCGSATAVEGYDAAKMHALGYGRSPAEMLFGDDSSSSDDDDYDDEDDDEDEDEDDSSESDEGEEEDESMRTSELDERMRGLRLSDCGWVLNSLRGWVGEDTRRHCRQEGYRAEAGAGAAWTAPCDRSSIRRGGGDDEEDERERAFIASQRQQSLAAMVTNKLAQMTAGCGGSTYAVLVRIRALVATFRMDAPIRGFTPAQQAVLAHVLCVLVTSGTAAPAAGDTLRVACTRFLDEHHVSDTEDLPDMLAVFF